MNTILGLVDRYIELSERRAAIEKEMNEIKEALKPYLDEHKKAVGTVGYLIQQSVMRVPTNSIYTSYELADIEEFLTPKTKKMVVEPRVSSVLLESAVKLGSVPKEALERKRTVETVQIRVKK